jgi:serine-type D-Ala-D-Ala carboxypeptidase/endopeptidase
MTSRNVSIAMVFSALSLIAVPGQDQTGQATHIDDVDSIVVRAATTFLKSAPQVTGVSIGILKGGQIYTYNHGTIEEGANHPPAADTLYPIASVTKTFTGTLLAIAAIEGKMKLDDDVRKYIEGNYPNLEYQGHPIRLEHLVNHNSGLPFNLPDIPENRPPFPPIGLEARRVLADYTRKDFLADLHKVEIKTMPGEKFSYSNSAAMLLSIILERVYGMPYEEIVKQKIAVPLGMQDTTMTVTAAQAKRLAKGYDEKGELQPYPLDMLLGAGALKSTVADLLKYAQWEMAERDPAVKISHEPRFVLSDNFSVGLNWQMLKSRPYRRIWQEGNLPGFMSMCVTLPELHVAVVALVNEDDKESSHAFSMMISDIAKGLDNRSAPLF